MARLLRGLCSLTLVTLFVACGDDGKKVVLCDGGACSDAKRDATNQDTPPKLDVPDANTDRPDAVADRPVETVAQPDAVSAEVAVTPDVAPRLDTAPQPDSAPDIAIPGPDTTPTVDQAQVPDVPITDDGGTDIAIPQLDTAGNLDAGSVDVNQADVPAPGLDTATLDTEPTPLDGSTDAEAIDGGCAGVLCSYFEQENIDAGTLPSGWAVIGAGNGWTLAPDGTTNQVLVQDDSSNTASYIEAGTAWTNMTITLRVKLLSVANNDSVRICGRFATTDMDGYCLYISSGNTGTTPGSLSLQVRQGGTATQLSGADASATGLAITVDTWHTYRLVISGAGPVTVSAYLDGATTATVTGTDSTAPYLTSGHFGIGTRNATADFDDLVVTSP